MWCPHNPVHFYYVYWFLNSVTSSTWKAPARSSKHSWQLSDISEYMLIFRQSNCPTQYAIYPKTTRILSIKRAFIVIIELWYVNTCSHLVKYYSQSSSCNIFCFLVVLNQSSFPFGSLNEWTPLQRWWLLMQQVSLLTIVLEYNIPLACNRERVTFMMICD